MTWSERYLGKQKQEKGIGCVVLTSEKAEAWMHYWQHLHRQIITHCEWKVLAADKGVWWVYLSSVLSIHLHLLFSNPPLTNNVFKSLV